MNMELKGCAIEAPAAIIDAIEKLLTLISETGVVTSSEELERYEQAVREHTNRLCGLVVIPLPTTLPDTALSLKREYEIGDAL